MGPKWRIFWIAILIAKISCCLEWCFQKYKFHQNRNLSSKVRRKSRKMIFWTHLSLKKIKMKKIDDYVWLLTGVKLFNKYSTVIICPKMNEVFQLLSTSFFVLIKFCLLTTLYVQGVQETDETYTILNEI